MYHGLLDWRLGLSFLEVLNFADFTCGFDGTFDTPSLQDWRELAMSYAEQMVERFGGSGEVARSKRLSGNIAWQKSIFIR
jgi:DEAD/DEAH box helicase domain-containing protein